MTATAQISDQPRTATLATESSDTLVWIATVATVLAAYLLLQNPYWVPAGDSEVHIAMARTLATGGGYLFNGQPVAQVPPGWPAILALLMKISPSFLFLKLANMSFMVGALAIAYRICRRFATPAQSAMAILLAALVANVYQSTFWLIAESAFCLTSAASILLAMQVAEGRAWKWRIPILIALCSASVFIRWAGVLSWLLVAAALVDGRAWPRRDRYWITLALTGIAAATTLFGLRYALWVPPEVTAQSSEFGGAGEESALPIPIEGADAAVAAPYSILTPARGSFEVFRRAVTWGDWLSYLFWQPFRIGGGSGIGRWINRLALLAGWSLLASVLIYAFHSLRKQQWFWPALVLYSFALAMNWTHPNARYLVPIAPFMLLGIFQGVAWVRAQFPRRWVRLICNSLWIAFVAALVLCNGALYAVDAYVARSGNFYAAYDAGLDANLISASRWVTERNVGDRQIAVSYRYVNYGKRRSTPFGLRSMAMLTDRSIIRIPDRRVTRGDPWQTPSFLTWCRNRGIRYYLYQPEISPWRVFHFRMGWLQELLTREPVEDSGAGWRLYEIPDEGPTALRIPLEPIPNWPTRVPGM